MSKKPMTFKEYKKLNLSQISDEILSYWEDNDILENQLKSQMIKIHLSFLKDLLQQMDFQEFIMF